MTRVPDLRLPSEPAHLQHQNKAAWNSGRCLEEADFFTAGYTGRDISILIDLLLDADVSTLVDVRHSPVSMYRPEFSKTSLAHHLADEGIEYLHLPHLGVPRDIRARAVRSGTRDTIWKWYDTHIVPTLSLYAFFNVAAHPIALMCTELDPTACHRHRLTLALERQGLKGFDL